MTRKRYINLLMAGRMSRNVATRIAKYASSVCHCSYRDAAMCSERTYRRMASCVEVLFLRDRWRLAADILHRALYGEVVHE